MPVTRDAPQELPDPASRRHRGRLKLYLSYAAGVGKTYRLLEEAHALRKRNVDVVIGWVETHDRPETAALVQGVEVVPRRRVEFRGLAVQELDLDAVLARRAQVAIVDDLPHANVPGSRHYKRFQDVLELLDAGISVIGALDIQHLESLGDLVERTTGFTIRETIPDTFLKQADQVVSLDLAVEDLLERLSDGKILAADKIAAARAGFFRSENLSVLRGLSLREVAESVDRAILQQPLHNERLKAADARVMVCLPSSSPRADMLLRRGSRLAGRLNTAWYAVHVETSRNSPGKIEGDALLRWHETIRMAQELGAEVVRLEAGDPVPALINFARSHGVGYLVIGRSLQPWWQRLLRRAHMDRLVQEAEGLDLHIVASD